MAAAYVKGIQSQGVYACPTHFAVTSQELRRMAMDSVVDERTLREIYLTGFEIAVKEGGAKALMTSYNQVNGTYAVSYTHLDVYKRQAYACHKGHRKIGFVGSRTKLHNFQERYEGYKQGLRRAGLPYQSKYVYETRCSTEGACQDMLELLKEEKDWPSILLSLIHI